LFQRYMPFLPLVLKARGILLVIIVSRHFSAIIMLLPTLLRKREVTRQRDTSLIKLQIHGAKIYPIIRINLWTETVFNVYSDIFLSVFS